MPHSQPKWSKAKILASQKSNALQKSQTAFLTKIIEEGSIKFMSSLDVAQTYGNSRQYWEKLFSQGKIPYRQTAAARITTNLWVEDYLDGRGEKTYPSLVLNVRRQVSANEENENSRRTIACPKCDIELPYEVVDYEKMTLNCSSCGFACVTPIPL